tara:strand:- start:1075 stop:1269 length:195 start_codon:yes stop_codon:yes gene_type:complete
VRETCDPEYTDEECPFPLKPEDISVVYVDSDDGYSKVTHIPIDEEGRFEKTWPKGFFEERMEEV